MQNNKKLNLNIHKVNIIVIKLRMSIISEIIPIKTIFLRNSTLGEHITSQNANYSEYIANLLLLFHEYNIEFTVLKLAKILVSAIVRQDKNLAIYLMKESRYDLPVILKCCEMLDSPRLQIQLTKKIEQLSLLSTPTVVKKIKTYKTLLSNLNSLAEGVNMRLTKSKINFIKINWIHNIPKERLEYMALLYPIKQWKILINLFHLKPIDFQLDWFTHYIFTKESPKNSIIDICSSITKETIKDVIIAYKLPYDFLRVKYKELLDVDIIKQVFTYTNLSNIIRHWNEFNTESNALEIIDRFDSEEQLDMPYGELMKRIQMLIESSDTNSIKLVNKLMEIAENKLTGYQIAIDQPVVVLGDASASMDVAIRTSSIITSILTKACNAKLHLFRNKDEPIAIPPANVKEVLNMMALFKAGSSTAPAASLYPYYERKELIKTFILITDEEENTGYLGSYGNVSAEDWFANTFKKYREEVYPAKLVFVSFLKNNKDGFMVSDLKRLIPGIEKDIIRFVMNNKNPDLRKLDELLNTLSINANLYNDKCSMIMKKFGDIGNNIFNNAIIKDILSNCENNIVINIDI